MHNDTCTFAIHGSHWVCCLTFSRNIKFILAIKDLLVFIDNNTLSVLNYKPLIGTHLMQYVELHALYVKTVLTLASALHVMHKPSGIFAEEKTLK